MSSRRVLPKCAFLVQVFVFCLVSGRSVEAQELLGSAPIPPVAPILSIETGAHLAQADAVVDVGADIIVTASRDTTIRERNLSTGALQHVYRVPIGLGNRGRIYALALSRDSRYIAVGGNLGFKRGESAVYVIDRSLREIVTVIDGLPGSVFKLAWSPGGEYLVAGTADGDIHVFESSSSDQYFTDDSEGPVSCLRFSPAGELFVVYETDPPVLFNRDFTERRSFDTGEDLPSCGAFSPGGELIAIGMRNRPVVKVYSRSTLEFAYETDSEGLQGWGFGAVAWSSDGQEIWATGWYAKSLRHPIFRWDDAGSGTRTTMGESYLQYRSLHLTDQHQVVVTDVDGGLKVGDMPHGADTLNAGTSYRSYSPFAVFPSAMQKLRVSDDGSLVRFRFGESTHSAVGAAHFAELDLKNLSVSVDPPPLIEEQYLLELDEIFSQAKEVPASQQRDIEKKALAVRNAYWDKYGDAEHPFRLPGPDPDYLSSPVRRTQSVSIEYGPSPKINGNPLRITSVDNGRIGAVFHDESGLILGTRWAVQRHDIDGKRIWKKPVLGRINDVNVAANGRVAVVLFQEGFVEWYAVETGELLLSFALSRDGKSWFFYTKEGYYHGTEDATSVLGMHINNGSRQLADFVPIDDFDATLHRPDLIRSRLDPDQSAFELAYAESGYSEVAQRALHTPTVTITADESVHLDLLETLERGMRLAIAEDLSEDFAGIDVEQWISAMLEEARAELESADFNDMYFGGVVLPIFIEATGSSASVELTIGSEDPVEVKVTEGNRVLSVHSVPAQASDPVILELPAGGDMRQYEIHAVNLRRGLLAPTQSVWVKSLGSTAME